MPYLVRPSFLLRRPPDVFRYMPLQTASLWPIWNTRLNAASKHNPNLSFTPHFHSVIHVISAPCEVLTLFANRFVAYTGAFALLSYSGMSPLSWYKMVYRGDLIHASMRINLRVCFPCIAFFFYLIRYLFLAKTTSGAACAIPFEYKDRLYSACTTVDNDDKLWCSTDTIYKGNWGDCRNAAICPKSCLAGM